MLRKYHSLLLLIILTVSLSACLSPSGNTVDEKRTAIQGMRDETLARLYQQRPTSRDIVDKSVGYAVFSNVNAQYIFFGGGGGYGVAFDKTSGSNTYMKMVQADLGLGLGVQDVRVVFVFHSRRAFDNFINSGWEFGGQADASAKARDKGLAATGEVSIDAETTMYTMSESGLMAKVNLAGTKYWKDAEMNQ